MTDAASLCARIAATVGRMRLDVELDTGAGTLVVVGPNGAGKSSLLDCLLGVRPVQRGRVSVGAEVVLDTERGVDVPLEQRRIGYVPQDYALFPHLTVRQNVAFALASAPAGGLDIAPPRGAGAVPRDAAARAARVEAVLAGLGLASLAQRRPRTLSGGEKQRVALARALSVSPRALLLDEPLAALDVHARREVRGFLAAYLERLALPTILVTHDAADARELGDRIAVFEAGAITQTATWDELARSPASRFVEEFVAATTGPGLDRP